MTVAEVDALLYLPGHPRQQLRRALRIPALSPGWQASFRALLEETRGSGNAGLVATSPPPAWAGFRPLTVTEIDARERVRDLHPPRGRRRPPRPRSPGQYLTLRVSPNGAGRCCAATRCAARPRRPYRIGVKREPDGVASGYLHTRLAVGDRARGRGAAGHVHPRPRRRAGAADQRRHRRDAGARDAQRARRASAPSGRSGGCTARAAAPTTRSPPRPARCSPRSRTRERTSATAARARTTPAHFDAAGRLTAPVARRARSAARRPGLHLRARRRSWTTSAPGSPRSARRRAASTPSRSGPRPARRPGIAATPARPPHPPPGEPGSGPDDRVRAQQPRGARGATTTRACSSSPRPATSPSAGPAAPASATAARRR